MASAHLTIKRGRIMASPECFKQILVGTLPKIILNTDDLRVIRSPCTHILIRRLVHSPLRIPDLGLRHSGYSLKRELNAPEAPGAELRELLPRRWGVIIGALSDGGAGRVGGDTSSAEAEGDS